MPASSELFPREAVRTMKKDMARLSQGGAVSEVSLKPNTDAVQAELKAQQAAAEVQRARMAKIEQEKKTAEQESRKIQQETERKTQEAQKIQGEQLLQEKAKTEARQQEAEAQQARLLQEQRMKEDERKKQEEMRLVEEKRRLDDERKKEEIRQREEKEQAVRVKTEETKRNSSEYRKKALADEKSRLQLEKNQIQPKIQEVWRLKRPLESRRGILAKEIAQADAIFKSLVDREAKIEEEENVIERKESGAFSAPERRTFEQQRWSIEEKRQDLEKKRWNWDEKLKNLDKRSQSLNQEFNLVLGKEEEVRFREEKISRRISEIESELGKILQEEKLEKLKTLKNSITGQRNVWEKKISLLQNEIERVVNIEQKIEADKKLTEQEERTTDNSGDRRKLEQQRWSIEEQRRKIESQRWIKEAEKEKMELQAQNLDKKIQELERLEETFQGKPPEKPMQKLPAAPREVNRVKQIFPVKSPQNHESFASKAALSFPVEKKMEGEMESEEALAPLSSPTTQEGNESSEDEKKLTTLREKIESLKKESEEYHKQQVQEVMQQELARQEAIMTEPKQSLSLPKAPSFSPSVKKESPIHTVEPEGVKKKIMDAIKNQRQGVPSVAPEIQGLQSSQPSVTERMESVKTPPKPSFIPAPPNPEAVKPLPKAPDAKRKLRIRVLIGSLLFILLVGQASFWYWFLVVRNRDPIIIPGTEEPGVNPPSETPEEPQAGANLFNPESSRTLTVAQSDQIAPLLSQAILEWQTNDSFQRLLLQRENDKTYFSLREIMDALQVRVPAGFYEKLGSNFNLFTYAQIEGNRIGFVSEVADPAALAQLFLAWESPMRDDIKPFMTLIAQDKSPLANTFRNSSTVKGYQGPAFRYRTYSRNDLGVLYLINERYLLFASSLRSMNKLIEKMDIKPPLEEITQELKRGSTGQQVRTLQGWLARDSAVYPEAIVNGTFGPATQRAVIRFQEKYSLEILAPQGLNRATGIVDLQTRTKLNQLYGRYQP